MSEQKLQGPAGGAPEAATDSVLQKAPALTPRPLIAQWRVEAGDGQLNCTRWPWYRGYSATEMRGIVVEKAEQLEAALAGQAQHLADLEAEMRRFAQQFPKALEWAEKIKNLSRVDGFPEGAHGDLPRRRTR